MCYEHGIADLRGKFGSERAARADRDRAPGLSAELSEEARRCME